jgi:predicted nucleic acid-binding protein
MDFVAVDTNALMRDYLLREANMQTFFRGCQRCHISVYVPEIVVDEVCANHEKEMNRQKSTLATAARKLVAMGIHGEETDFDVKDAAQKYRELILQTFRDYDVTVARTLALHLKHWSTRRTPAKNHSRRPGKVSRIS